MNARRLLILALLLAGCAHADKLLPDRAAIGVNVDADAREIKTYNGTLYWSLR